MGLIELHGVTKAFFVDRHKTQAKVALDSLDLTIEEGEFVSLVGPSGCGKTVTLSMMAGFVKPTLGEVRFKDEPIVGPGPERGVVFQEYSLFPWQSVKRNVMFAARNALRASGHRVNAAELDRRVMASLATVGLLDVANARPNTLSGGMKQRVAIARLLAMDSSVFLMDEPFSALDEQTRRALDESIFDLWRHERKTIVFVTHDISEAVRMSSRIVLFSHSPGTIMGEWRLPNQADRDLSRSPFKEICEEVRACMPSSSCSFAFEWE